MAGVGSLIMLAVVWFGLGLNPVNSAARSVLSLLAAACFTAIAHLLRTWLGVVGSAITLVLLMVQLTSAGGLYPVETLPAPFRAIHTVIPMTYLVDALRITFTGGPTDHLWRDVAVLCRVHRRRRRGCASSWCTGGDVQGQGSAPGARLSSGSRSGRPGATRSPDHATVILKHC